MSKYESTELETDPSKWELVTEEMLKDYFAENLRRKAKRGDTRTFYNGYGMVVKK